LQNQSFMPKKIPQKYKHLKDKDLLHKYSVEGDGYAFLVLYQRYEQRLRGFFSNKIQNRQDVEGAIQLTYEKLIGSKQLKNNQVENFGKYLIGIAFNVCRNYYKKKKRINEVFSVLNKREQLPEIPELDGVLDPTDYQKKELKIAAIHEAIATELTEEQQKVIGFVLQGLSLKEIAEQMDKSYSSITSLKNRAISRLKKAC